MDSRHEVRDVKPKIVELKRFLVPEQAVLDGENRGTMIRKSPWSEVDIGVLQRGKPHGITQNSIKLPSDSLDIQRDHYGPGNP